MRRCVDSQASVPQFSPPPLSLAAGAFVFLACARVFEQMMRVTAAFGIHAAR